MLSKKKPHRIFSGEIPLPQRLLEFQKGGIGQLHILHIFLKVKTLFFFKNHYLLNF